MQYYLLDFNLIFIILNLLLCLESLQTFLIVKI
jgi:hypothetical protein